MKLTNRKKTIDFQNVGELLRIFEGRKIIQTRFSIEIPREEMCNLIYAAMLAEVSVRGFKLSYDSATKEHIVKAADWLIDPDKKPGLLLMGSVGNGKTTLARSIATVVNCLTEMEFGYNRYPQVKFRTAKEICYLRAKKIDHTFKEDKSDFDKIRETKMLIIDELGEEPKELLIYGQPVTPLIDLLSERYDKQMFTIVTTNLGRTSLNEKYKERIYDRMCEWLQPIPFTNDSYRNPNHSAP